MILRLSIVLTLLAAVLIAPFAFRPDKSSNSLLTRKGARLVIITPHNESIQSEFGRAFIRHMEESQNSCVYIDWRQPGGTSQIARFLRSEYAARFETLWKEKTGLPFTLGIRDAFANSKLDGDLALARGENGGTKQGWVSDLTLLNEASDEQKALAARHLFLESEIGAGIDLFFGGGAYDFSKQAGAGNLVGSDGSGKFGPAILAEQEPDWFSDDIMPESVSGEPFRDSEYRWVGTVLSSFGICYNTDVLTRLGIDSPPSSWSDLQNPKLFGQIALADPTKSGSTTKAFEMLIQERIQTLQREQNFPEQEAVEAGWDDAMRLIMKISANSRYFTDAAAKVPRDVAMGDAAVGMCIDFYGRTFNEMFRGENGAESRVQFLMPRGGTSIGADPIGMLRGAPNPSLAHEFVRFVLSPDGQKLWNYGPGTPGGPERFALRRPPIRKDFYNAENRKHMTDPDVNPYEISAGFIYHPEWTGSLFASLRFAIRASCMDPHEEQQHAWQALIEAGMPPEGLAEFDAIGPVSYQSVLSEIVPALNSKDKISEVALGRHISDHFRKQYLQIAKKWEVSR